MPVLILPDDLSEQLKQSDSGKIDNTDGPGVAVYWSSDKRVRADIYIGLKLDGLNLYRNTNSIDPNVKMLFALPPDVICQTEVRTFNSDFDSVIGIQVGQLYHGFC